jgi:predicted RNA-binding protein with TRAM domain
MNESTVKEGQILNVHIDSFGKRGNLVAHHEGMVIFIDSVIKIKIKRVSKNCAFSEAI